MSGISLHVEDHGNFYIFNGGSIEKIDDEITLKSTDQYTFLTIVKVLESFQEIPGTAKYLYIDNKGVSNDLETQVKTQLLKKGEYGPLKKGTPGILWSIYKMLLREKIMKRFKFSKIHEKKIISEHKKGKDITELVTHYDLAPLTIIRTILPGYGYNDVKKVLADPEKVIKKKHEYLIDDIEWAEENDAILGSSRHVSQEKAELYEKKIAKFLDEQGIRYETQEDLLEEQKKKIGKAIATPDFLLLDKVYLNDKPIAWIDAKNYYGIDTPFVQKSIQKQIGKYNKIWGHGAIWFSAGFSEGMKVPGAELVSFQGK